MYKCTFYCICTSRVRSSHRTVFVYVCVGRLFDRAQRHAGRHAVARNLINVGCTTRRCSAAVAAHVQKYMFRFYLQTCKVIVGTLISIYTFACVFYIDAQKNINLKVTNINTHTHAHTYVCNNNIHKFTRSVALAVGKNIPRSSYL